MSKFLKFSLFITIFFILFLNCYSVFATVDMNLNDNNTNSTNNVNTLNSQNTANTNNNNESTNPQSNSSSSSFSSTVTTSDFDLQLTNILTICLIVVGLLLILLGIAIIIRLKK